MPRPRLTKKQHQTIRKNQEAQRQQLADLEPHDSTLREGLVIAHFGTETLIEALDGKTWRCHCRRHLEKPVCGDRAIWQQETRSSGVITALQPRKNLLYRVDTRQKTKAIAANLDSVAIIISHTPAADFLLLDRFLAAIKLLDLSALIIRNKIDLIDDQDPLEERVNVYKKLHYPVISTSTRTPDGLTALQNHLKNHSTLLCGQSGVGKSSIVKALLPDHDIRVQAISDVTGLGTHTTTTSILYHLPRGGQLIDSPGVRNFALPEHLNEHLIEGFAEFSPWLGQCRFSNCSHRHEPGCALLQAVQDGSIDARRLENYHRMINT